MTPQAILRASLCRPSEYAQRLREAEIDNLGFAPEYAEPGYTNPTRGIVFANWNLFTSEACDLLERAGWALEWSDEWTTCGECGRAVRTSPDFWDDLSQERSGYYRAFWTGDGRFGSPVIGYCSPGGSHRTIRAVVTEVRRLYPSEPVYRHGRVIQ